MVIAGLIIALGEVVDDAIIDVENIVRRLRLNRAAGEPRSAFEVVLDASLEVRSAVVYGSLIVVLVFLPVFFLDGLAGSFFRPLALAYVLAIAASLLVALIVTPALSLMLLPQATHEREAPVVSAAEGRATAGVLPASGRRAAPGARRSSRCRSLAARRRLPVSRRGVPAALQGIRLPDALGREARDLAGRDAADHPAGQRGAARHPRRAQLRRPHRPGRGRRRGRGHQLHRAVDQPRSIGRLRRARSPRCRRWSTAIRVCSAIC